MSNITFIDNQPVRFLSAKFDDQACINTDDSAYSMLVQEEDPVCVQVKRGCEGTNIACPSDEVSSEKVTDGDFSNAASFTVTGDWAIAGGQATLTAAGNDGSITQSGLVITIGEQYQVQLDVVSNTTGFEISVYLGGRRIGLIPQNFTGTYTLYGPTGTTNAVSFGANNDYDVPDSGEIVVDNLSVKQIAFCYQFDVTELEHVVNGTFTGNADGWTGQSGWGYATNDVDAIAVDDTKYFYQELPNIPHRQDIAFSVELTARSAGSFSVSYGGVDLETGLVGETAIQVHTQNYPAYGLGDDILRIRGSSGTPFTGTIDNVSAIETSSGWEYDPVSGFCHVPGWANAFYSTEPAEIGFTYFYEFEIEVIAGSVYVEFAGQSIGTFTQSGIYSFFVTALTTDQDKYTPSSDFEGCISPNITICKSTADVQFRLIYQDGAGATDWHTSASSQDAVRYDDEYVSWCITTLTDALSGGVGVALPYGCYYVQVRDGEGDPTTSDTIINYKQTHDCTKRIRAWCDGEELGFQFGDNGNFFTLVQRFRTLYMRPVYPNEGEDYEYSTGTSRRIYAKRTKNYEMQFDRMDEYAHDTVSVMIVCDDFEIDGVEYLVPFKDYEPEWVERGKRNLAMSTIEIQKRIVGTLFNRNCPSE